MPFMVQDAELGVWREWLGLQAGGQGLGSRLGADTLSLLATKFWVGAPSRSMNSNQGFCYEGAKVGGQNMFNGLLHWIISFKYLGMWYVDLHLNSYSGSQKC